MITVKEKTKEMEVPTGNSKNGNGDQYWLRPFNSLESIERCRRFEGRGTEFKVKTGLELYLAKLNLRHGSWYPYLHRADIYPTTATRRMKIAKEFMVWLELLGKVDKVTEHHVHDALKNIHSKECKLHDFAQSIKVDLDTFHNELPKAAREKAGVKLDPYEIIGFNPFELKGRVLKRWDFLTATEQIDTFLLTMNCIPQVVDLASHLKSLLPELRSDLNYLQKQGKLAEQVSNSLSQIESQNWGLRELEWGRIFHRQGSNHEEGPCINWS